MIAEARALFAYVIRTWLFWMSGAFSLLLTAFGLWRAAVGSPISPHGTLLILGCLSVVAFVMSYNPKLWIGALMRKAAYPSV